MLVEEETYLKHYGVRGMHWGVRTQRRAGKKRKFQNKGPIRRKIAGTTAVLNLGIGTYVATNKTMSTPFRVAIGGANLLVGAATVKKLSETKMHKQIRELRDSQANSSTT